MRNRALDIVRSMTPKPSWMSAVLAAVLLVGCELPASMPDYPYDLPRADDAEVVHVDLVGAESGHIIDARLPDEKLPSRSMWPTSSRPPTDNRRIRKQSQR